MTNPPNGQLVQTPDGNELVVSRRFRAPIEDMWVSVTDARPHRPMDRYLEG